MSLPSRRKFEPPFSRYKLSKKKIPIINPGTERISSIRLVDFLIFNCSINRVIHQDSFRVRSVQAQASALQISPMPPAMIAQRDSRHRSRRKSGPVVAIVQVHMPLGMLMQLPLPCCLSSPTQHRFL